MTTVLDDRTRALRDRVAGMAREFRAVGAGLDRHPDSIGDHLDVPGVAFLTRMLVPPEYGGTGLRVGGYTFHGTTALERTVVLEELARGDAGVMLAAPGASMSGVLVDMLGDDGQKALFYERLLARPTWTFFALTEPERGSDAGAMQTALVPDDGSGGYRLHGAKRYVGNAGRAAMGVVFARTRPGPLGVTAVLVDTDRPGFRAEPLPMLGLRGARFCAVTLDGVAVPADRVLGRHLSRTRRGMWACARTFNRLRPGVAGIALGIARAAHDYVADEHPPRDAARRDTLERLGARIEGVRALVHLSAVEVDADAGNGVLASAAKAQACTLADAATRTACELLGPRARFEHPALDKLVRDAKGVEFMEGTGNIQKLTVFHGVLSGKVGHADPFGAHTAVTSGGAPCA